MKYEFDDSWKEWIQTNIQRGCDKEGMVDILLEHEFDPALIKKEMNRQTTPLKTIYTNVKKSIGSLFSNKKNVTLGENALDDVVLSHAKKIETDKVHMYVIDDFLSDEECDEVIERIKAKCRPSTISNPDEVDKNFRTSKTCDLSFLEDVFIDDLDRRISDYMGYEVERAEGIQGQYYEVGDEFKTHTDYFEPNTQEYSDFAAESGQRTWTFMIYLNDVPEGGETEFTKLGLKFTPKKGQAVIWNSLKEDGQVNINTLHWAKPIRKGEKFVITKWFRTHGSLTHPFKPYLHTKIPVFTKTGFKKIKLPETLYAKIHDFYETNRVDAVQESDAAIGTFIHSEGEQAPSKMVELSDALRSDIFETVNPILEEWCGKKLNNTAVYGIREYQDGATLDMHVDRYETHVISMIINVDQEVNKDWPLYIYDHFSRLHKVVLSPGDVVFYESAKIAHGRPEALDGNRYANIFAHTMPENWEDTSRYLSEQLNNGKIQQRMKFAL